MTKDQKYDVIVVGAGNAALTAALSARERGANVLVLEIAPEHLRGGNTYFSGGGFRFAHNGLEDVREIIPDMSETEAESVDLPPYSQQDFHDDLMRVTEGLSDAKMAHTLVSESLPTMKWMQQKGMRWLLMFGRQSFMVDGKYRFWGGLNIEAVGGGAGLSDRLIELVERDGIDVRYNVKAQQLLLDENGRIRGLRLQSNGGYEEIAADAVVLACGGFEANPEWRTRYLGPGWELAKVRGTRYNTGIGIRWAIGAQPYGHWSGCHAVAWDAGAPPFGDRKIGDLFQKHSYQLGLIVNRDAERFVDEGADLRNYTYAKYGREILFQPGRLAFQLFDENVRDKLRDEYNIPQVTMARGNTIEELADGLDLDPATLARTIQEYNAAVQDGHYDPSVLDGKHTDGVAPPKSNWAQRLDTPPYLGYAVTCGITFTFGGLRIGRQGQVLDTEDRQIPGLFAAGELVGGLFYHNYPGGSGLMAGAVFGRIAGAGAGVYVQSA